MLEVGSVYLGPTAAQYWCFMLKQSFPFTSPLAVDLVDSDLFVP